MGEEEVAPSFILITTTQESFSLSLGDYAHLHNHDCHGKESGLTFIQHDQLFGNCSQQFPFLKYMV